MFMEKRLLSRETRENADKQPDDCSNYQHGNHKRTTCHPHGTEPSMNEKQSDGLNDGCVCAQNHNRITTPVAQHRDIAQWLAGEEQGCDGHKRHAIKQQVVGHNLHVDVDAAGHKIDGHKHRNCNQPCPTLGRMRLESAVLLEHGAEHKIRQPHQRSVEMERQLHVIDKQQVSNHRNHHNRTQCNHRFEPALQGIVNDVYLKKAHQKPERQV